MMKFEYNNFYKLFLETYGGNKTIYPEKLLRDTTDILIKKNILKTA